MELKEIEISLHEVFNGLKHSELICQEGEVGITIDLNPDLQLAITYSSKDIKGLTFILSKYEAPIEREIRTLFGEVHKRKMRKALILKETKIVYPFDYSKCSKEAFTAYLNQCTINYRHLMNI